MYGLSDQALFQINNLVEGVLNNAADETRTVIKQKKKLVEQINEYESYLTLDINEKELKDIYEKIKIAEQVIIDDQVKIAELEQRRSAVNSQVMTVTEELKEYAGYYQLMKENIGDEFTLKYDENSKSTSIERGYLIGAKL